MIAVRPQSPTLIPGTQFDGAQPARLLNATTGTRFTYGTLDQLVEEICLVSTNGRPEDGWRGSWLQRAFGWVRRVRLYVGFKQHPLLSANTPWVVTQTAKGRPIQSGADVLVETYRATFTELEGLFEKMVDAAEQVQTGMEPYSIREALNRHNPSNPA